MSEEKAKVFAAVFNQPRQFLGIEGVDETRVFSGRVEDVPEAVGNSAAFGIYKNDGSVIVVGELEDPKEPAPPAGKEGVSEDLQGNVKETLAAADGLSKDQLIDLRDREAKEQNRKGVIDGLDALIAAKG